MQKHRFGCCSFFHISSVSNYFSSIFTLLNPTERAKALRILGNGRATFYTNTNSLLLHRKMSFFRKIKLRQKQSITTVFMTKVLSNLDQNLRIYRTIKTSQNSETHVQQVSVLHITLQCNFYRNVLSSSFVFSLSLMFIYSCHYCLPVCSHFIFFRLHLQACYLVY